MEVTRTCESCGNINTFTVHKKKKYTVGHYCKDCRKAEQKAIRAAHPDVMKDRDLKKTFGISLEIYKKMFDAQGGVCAICSRPEHHVRLGKLTQLRVDHDHVTGKIRGLLCNSCNAALGYTEDKISTLLAAAHYLEVHEGKGIPFF